jgi:hypothetical protein
MAEEIHSREAETLDFMKDLLTIDVTKAGRRTGRQAGRQADRQAYF